jgi:hypothetical protein
MKILDVDTRAEGSIGRYDNGILTLLSDFSHSLTVLSFDTTMNKEHRAPKLCVFSNVLVEWSPMFLDQLKQDQGISFE